MGDAALLDELLRRQARAHGLASWADTAAGEDAPDAATRAELAEEAERLTTFAGMRGAAAAAAEADVAEDGVPLSPMAEAAHDVAALEAHGLEQLKAELARLGLKCGGTLAERAARLWALRRRTRLHAEDAALLARPRDAPPARGAKRVARQGPLLPGQTRAKVTKTDTLQ
jgi:ParB-like chromosome segregation protein Spo0J